MADRKSPTAGKGDKPRTINNQNWRDNYDQIKGFGRKTRSDYEVEGFRGKPPMEGFKR